MAYGDPKVAVDLKDAEHGEIIFTDTSGKKHTYYPNYNIWLVVQTLEVFTILGEPKEADSEPPLIIRVRGTVSLEDYSISVVGDSGSKVNTLNISFETGDWRPKPKEPKPGSFPSMHSCLGGAMLGFNRADWEIGNRDDWWIACYLPKPFMESMVSDIRDRQLNEMKLSLALQGLYTTKHSMAPVSSRGHLFIRPNKDDNTIELPEMASGHVRAIHFASARLDLSRREPPESENTCVIDQEMPVTAREDSVGIAIEALNAQIEKIRGTVKWIGGFVVVALLLIAFR